ncbi:MAG: ATP-grasp domain-containing protein [Nocardioidaceae bacterium]
MADSARHLIGLLLGAEQDWPRAFEEILRRVGPITDRAGRVHELSSERLTIEPFNLDDPVRTDLVIDRLAHWYYHPREWLKKAALMDDTYLMNSPFTFQSMEKHSAYCAMLRLGLKIPRTVLVPYKNPVDNVRWAYTAAKYNRPFDLDAIAEDIGYPMYMKPFDGGGWRGVSRINNRTDLHRAYDDSGEMLMHLQATVDYDVFARALSIGPETMVMRFRPDEPMHDRYAVAYDFLSPSAGTQCTAISRVVNAFFGWEFNSAEMLVKGDGVYPIDYANACPDVAVTSLHYYFPWAITALVRWSAYCLVTGRRVHVDLQTRRFFEIADDDTRDYHAKLEAYLALADEYFETDLYRQWCAEHLPHLEEQVFEWVTGPGFDRLLRDTVDATYSPHERERFLAHFRGLIELWVNDERARLATA